MSIYDIVNRVCESQEKIELMGDMTGAAVAVGLVLAIAGSICLILHLVHKYDI